jgi:hypothetical protein
VQWPRPAQRHDGTAAAKTEGERVEQPITVSEIARKSVHTACAGCGKQRTQHLAGAAHSKQKCGYSAHRDRRGRKSRGMTHVAREQHRVQNRPVKHDSKRGCSQSLGLTSDGGDGECNQQRRRHRHEHNVRLTETDDGRRQPHVPVAGEDAANGEQQRQEQDAG